MPVDSIKVVGLRDLAKALRAIDRDLPKELGVGLAKASAIVADAMRPKIPRRTGRARASVKVRRKQSAAVLAVGGARVPYYGWLEFGGKVGRGGATRRPFIPNGRYLYPTLADKDAEVKAQIDEVVARLAVRAGFETSGSGSHG